MACGHTPRGAGLWPAAIRHGPRRYCIRAAPLPPHYRYHEVIFPSPLSFGEGRGGARKAGGGEGWGYGICRNLPELMILAMAVDALLSELRPG